MVKPDNVRVVITLPKLLKETLEKEAATQNRSLSNYIGMLLKQKEESNV